MQVVFSIEGDLLGGCIRFAYGKIVLEMDVGVVRNRDGRVCRERSGFAPIAQRFINEVCTIAARPFRVSNCFLTQATGEVGAKSILAALTIVEEFGIEIFAGSEAASDQ